MTPVALIWNSSNLPLEFVLHSENFNEVRPVRASAILLDRLGGQRLAMEFTEEHIGDSYLRQREAEKILILRRSDIAEAAEITKCVIHGPEGLREFRGLIMIPPGRAGNSEWWVTNELLGATRNQQILQNLEESFG